MNASVREEKNKIRRELLALRQSISCEEKQRFESTMAHKLTSLASYRYAEAVLLYFPIKGEPDLMAQVFDAATRSGKQVAFPLCHPEDCTLTFHIVRSLDELNDGTYGTKEPSPDAPLYVPSPDKHDIMLVPGISYDKKGFRLGYGKGYYDRYLAEFGGTAVGVTFSVLLRDSLPKGRYDRSVDVVLTERGASSTL
jgi:5-formyltetrahydrofolate cyclo-ligase